MNERKHVLGCRFATERRSYESGVRAQAGNGATCRQALGQPMSASNYQHMERVAAALSLVAEHARAWQAVGQSEMSALAILACLIGSRKLRRRRKRLKTLCNGSN